MPTLQPSQVAAGERREAVLEGGVMELYPEQALHFQILSYVVSLWTQQPRCAVFYGRLGRTDSGLQRD